MIFQTAIRTLLLLFIVAGGLTACSSTATQAATGGKARPVDVGDLAARVAYQQVGTPYLYGGNSPRGFDCSGLVHFSYSKVGHAVPRTTRALWHQAQPVANGELLPGDVLFFDVDGKMSHVGVYLGDNRFVHAPSSGKFVSIASLKSPYYAQSFIRAGRLR